MVCSERGGGFDVLTDDKAVSVPRKMCKTTSDADTFVHICLLASLSANDSDVGVSLDGVNSSARRD